MMWDYEKKEKSVMRITARFRAQDDVLPCARRYALAAQQEENERRFWAGVHREIMQISTAPPEVKARSREWLINNGFSLGA